MISRHGEWEQINWEQMQELFHLATSLPPGERTRVLTEASNDPELVQHVLELLQAESTDVEDSTSSAFDICSRVGPYVLLSHLGTGGNGSVYLVERVFGGAIQRCALKVLGIQARTPGFQSRFLHEQQILTSLNHPHITRFLDAGFSEIGQPFLVMEYVDGTDLLRFCDEKKLSITERVELFLQVCEAVAYAHRNLTVHLDLKPANALVTSAGDVKLLDFGTARILSDDTRKATVQLATPAYASPEQLRQESASTACDIYSLGVVLFEVLAGTRPFHSNSSAMLFDHAFRGDEAPALSSVRVSLKDAENRSSTPERLARMFQRELTVVVARCLRPAAKDRYATVESLVDDLRRYLQGLPVLARRQTIRYRIAKFVTRNRWPVLAASLAIVGIIASLSFAALREHQALRSAQRAVQMRTFMSQLFKLANPDYTGKPAASVPQFLELGAAVLPALVADPGDRRAAKLSLAESMYDAGATKDAKRLFSEVVPEAEQAGDLNAEVEAEAYAGAIAYDEGDVAHGEVLARKALARVNSRKVLPETRIRAELFYAHNREDEGYRTPENLRLTQAAVAETRSAHLPQHQLAYALTNLAGLLGPRGDMPGQEKSLHEALSIYDDEPWAVCDRAEVNQDLALIDNQKRAFDASLAHMRESYRNQVLCSGEGNRRSLERQSYIAAALISLGRAGEAVPLLEASLPRWTAIVGDDSDQLATPLLFLTRAYNMTGQFDKGVQTASHLVRVEKPRINPLSAQMGVCQLVWAQALAGEHKDAEALEHALLADEAFHAEGASKAPGTIRNANTAHDLVVKLRTSR